MPHTFIHVYYIKSFKEFNTISFDSTYCTIRLDDDDGLSPNFIENLQKYKNKHGTIISYPNGKYVTIENNELVMGKEISKRNNAQGLCAIGMNIYACGNHANVAERFKVIYDNTPNMYLLNSSIHCDSARSFVPA